MGGRGRTLAWLGLGLLLLVAAVLLAPAVFRLLVGLGWVDPTAVSGGDPFGRVLRRMLLVPVAVVVVVGLRPWRDLSLRDMGLVGPPAQRGTGWIAFCATLAAVLGLLGVHVLAGWLAVSVHEPAGAIAWRVAKTLGTAAVVGCLEEWFFRAWLPTRLGARAGAALSALLFAAVHAVRSSALTEPVEPSAAGALSALSRWGSTLVDPATFGPTFLGLLLLATLLTGLYRRTGTLWAPIGVHAAGIWALQAYGAFTERLPTPAWAGTKQLLDGVPGWALLAVACALTWGAGGARRGTSGASAA